MPSSNKMRKSPFGNLYTSIRSSVNVFSSTNGKKVITFKEVKNPSELCFSKSGKLFAVKNTSGKITVYDMKGLLCIKTYLPSKREGANLFFTPDEKYIISADWDGNIYLIDIESKISKIIMKIDFRINHIEEIEEDKIYIFQSEKSYVRWKYPFEYNKPQAVKIDKERGRRIYCSANQLYLANYKYEKFIDVYNSYDNLIKKIYSNGKSADEYIIKRNASWSSDGKYLAIICSKELALDDNDLIRVIRYSDLCVVKEYKLQYISYVEFTEDGQELLIGTWKNSYVIDINDVLDIETVDKTADYVKEETDIEELTLYDQFYALLDKINDIAKNNDVEFGKAVEKLTYKERMLFYVWEFSAQLDNGGLSSYILGYSKNYIENLTGYLENLDLKEHVKLVKKALELYLTDGNDEFNANWEELDSICSNLDENIECSLENFLEE